MRRSSAWRRRTRSSGTRPSSRTTFCPRWRISRQRCASCMRSKRGAALAYTFLFFLSGATGLIYELLWVRVLYQSFGSTIQSVTTVVAAYMGGLGLGAWLLGRRADRSPRPAVLYGWLEIAIGVFGIISPLVLALAHWAYIGIAGALGLEGGAVTVALRFGLAALVLLIPTTLMGGTLPVLTRALMGEDRGLLKPWLGRLYGLNTLGAMTGTALAGFFLIEFAGVRASLWATAAVNLAIGAAAIALGRDQSVLDPGRQPGDEPIPTRDHLRTLALILLGLTAFAALLNEIAWTRVLVMVVGGSTYAFTLILLVFLLGIGLGSVLVARRSLPRADTAASAALAQGVTGVGAAALFLFFGLLPSYIIAVFQIPDLSAASRLGLMGVAVGAVVLIPAIGMGMTFPLLTDLTARTRQARGADVGAAYALNTIGSILGAVLTGFLLVVVLGTQVTLRVGLVVNGLAALALAAIAARGVAEASAEHRRLRVRVLAGGALGTLALLSAAAAPGWSTRLIDLGPTIYARQRMDKAERQRFLVHRGVRQLAYREGPNATVSVWEGETGRSLRVNGKVDGSDRGDMDTQIMLGLGPAAARVAPTSALVIGYGTGVTAHVLASVPGLTQVKVVGIELYQLPLPVVAGIVRSLHEVFPHINVWFGGTADLIVLASARPLTYDHDWLTLLLRPGSAVRTLSREWLNVESPDEYAGRLLLGDSGVARLVTRATFRHSDDRPRLEFVAARRFLDPDGGTYAVFDSLVQIGNRGDATSPFQLLRIVAARRSDAGLLPYLEAAHRTQPDVVEWSVRTAGIRLALGDTAQADSLLNVVIAHTPRPDALLMRALLAAARNKPSAALALREALAAGADTAQARAALALLAVRGSRWSEAAIQARGALSAAAGTFHHPFPGEFLSQALGQIALDAPAPQADSVLSYAAARRPGSARYRELAAVAALRAGRCEEAAASFVELLDFALQRDNGPALVRECWAGQEPTVGTGTSARGAAAGGKAKH